MIAPLVVGALTPNVSNHSKHHGVKSVKSGQLDKTESSYTSAFSVYKSSVTEVRPDLLVTSNYACNRRNGLCGVELVRMHKEDVHSGTP